jgi:hypothetical protein
MTETWAGPSARDTSHIEELDRVARKTMSILRKPIGASAIATASAALGQSRSRCFEDQAVESTEDNIRAVDLQLFGYPWHSPVQSEVRETGLTNDFSLLRRCRASLTERKDSAKDTDQQRSDAPECATEMISEQCIE